MNKKPGTKEYIWKTSHKIKQKLAYVNMLILQNIKIIYIRCLTGRTLKSPCTWFREHYVIIDGESWTISLIPSNSEKMKTENLETNNPTSLSQMLSKVITWTY